MLLFFYMQQYFFSGKVGTIPYSQFRQHLDEGDVRTANDFTDRRSRSGILDRDACGPGDRAVTGHQSVRGGIRLAITRTATAVHHHFFARLAYLGGGTHESQLLLLGKNRG